MADDKEFLSRRLRAEVRKREIMADPRYTGTNADARRLLMQELEAVNQVLQSYKENSQWT